MTRDQRKRAHRKRESTRANKKQIKRNTWLIGPDLWSQWDQERARAQGWGILPKSNIVRDAMIVSIDPSRWSGADARAWVIDQAAHRDIKLCERAMLAVIASNLRDE